MKVILVSVLSLAAVPAAVEGQRATRLDEVMRRAHTYVAIYEDHELSSLISREHYQQQLLRADESVKEQRTLLSDYVLFQLPPDEDWFALRDVYDVDGAPVPDRSDRLKALFDAPRDQIGEQAMAIDRDSARFNLGDVPRTVNLPTFALRFLRPANRKRFDFKKQGEERVGDTVTWVVGYRETKSPTFTVSTDGRDVPASGRFWIDPETGAVLKTEMILGGTRGLRSRATVTVTYTLEPSLGFRVPTEMRERYDNPRRKGDGVIVAQATYSNFRPVDWRALK